MHTMAIKVIIILHFKGFFCDQELEFRNHTQWGDVQHGDMETEMIDSEINIELKFIIDWNDDLYCTH